MILHRKYLQCLVISIFSSLVSPKVVILAPVVQVLTGTKLSCSATGTPPIYIAIIRNSTTLRNTTTSASIPVTERGNYTCRATSKYGTDEKQVVFINGEYTRLFHFNVVIKMCGPVARTVTDKRIFAQPRVYFKPVYFGVNTCDFVTVNLAGFYTEVEPFRNNHI